MARTVKQHLHILRDQPKLSNTCRCLFTEKSNITYKSMRKMFGNALHVGVKK